jgi:hypothetical protein
MTGDSGRGSGRSDGARAGRPSGVTLSAERQRVIDALCEHFARDALTVSEFERRLDEAHRAGEREALAALLGDLPPLGGSRAVQGAGARGAGGGKGEGGSGSHDSGKAMVAGYGDGASGGSLAGPDGSFGSVPAERVPDSQFSVAIFSGRSRRGAWVPARKIRAVAVMGGIELDFREALFGTDLVEVHVVALMGGVEVLVPPGVHVDTGGFAFLGGFDEQLGMPEDLPAHAPTVRITGMAVMGGVEVSRRNPGESSRQARSRLKRERKKALESGEERRGG